MKIRAAVLHAMGVPPPYSESKPIAIESLELDDPGQGEVLVKIAAAGLCHSAIDPHGCRATASDEACREPSTR
jgi:Zn-dependent alcohol dehydrogenase